MSLKAESRQRGCFGCSKSLDASGVLQFASDEQEDRGRLKGWLSFASKKLREDKDFVLEVVSKSGNMLEAASDKLKDDKDVVFCCKG